MSLFKKVVLSFIFVGVLAIGFNGRAKAFVNIPDEFRNGVSKVFVECFDGIYGTYKYQYGITDDDINKGIEIGRGIPIKAVIYENLSSTNKGMDDILASYDETIYIFFPRVGGKVIGACQAAKSEKSYSVDSAGVNPSLESWIDYGFNVMKGNKSFTSSDVILVDFGVDTYGLYSKVDGNVVMISDSKTLGFKKGEVITFKDIHSRMMKVIARNGEAVGASASKGENPSYSYALVIGSTIVMAGVFIFVVKKLNKNS
ncbi:MAG: hypothetical protein RR840_10635 [Clostridium sp.]